MMIRAKFGIWALLVSVVCWPPSAAAAATPNQLGNAKISLKTVMDAAYSKVDCRRLIGAAERRHRIPAPYSGTIAVGHRIDGIRPMDGENGGNNCLALDRLCSRRG
jgi:hypothetical protein